MKTIRIGSDFSGVGAFDYAINRIADKKGFQVENVFACDMDKYARTSYLANHKAPKYYPENVYEREIDSESLDIYMTSPPCQAFSLAGKRKGKEDKRGILFFNSHEFIKTNNPRFFIFENVKGLLSDDGGKTFQEWINMLGGKSVNGLPILFPYEESVPYHVYHQVLNTKKHGVPQNRERVFIIGIRDDSDNNFQFPVEEHLQIKLKDILESSVSKKYFLSDKIQSQLVLNKKSGSVIGSTKPEFRTIGERDNVHNIESYMSCLTATDYKQPKQILVKSNTKKGYDIATENDSVNFSVPTSETRNQKRKSRSRTLDTQCNQAVLREGNVRRLTPLECFRLQDFPDIHVENSINAGVSDSQLYKQAGNSITVRVLEKIIDKLPL
jgi:DNA (cytosine-5)-methyltransferase 1